MKMCPTCGQPMPIKRYGVVMSQFKADIFDAIMRNNGIRPDDLYKKVIKPRSRNCMKSHIWQINEMLTDHRIVCAFDDRAGRIYKLVRL